jgi:FAD/FMN-containing dehydrogenase
MSELTVTTTTGGDAALEEATVAEFKASLGGQLLLPGEDGYDDARKLWNGMIDKRPALIARCAGAEDVISCVNFARANDLLVSVRGGDHSAAGNALCDGGLMIDLSLMKSISVDPAKRIARAGGGSRWGDFDRETQAFGLATTGGSVSDTGVGGLTLGGGLGWLAGKYGLACDNLLSADVVTADGRFLTASGAENADLFWGLRGGSGNFGVVTSFEFQLHPVGPTVLAGMVMYPFERAKEALRFYGDFSSDIPDELNTFGLLVTSPEGIPVVAIAVCYNGPIDKGEEVLRPLREFGPPLVDQISPMPYTVIQTSLDEAFPRGRHYYWKANLLKDISDDLIDDLVEHFATVPSPLSGIGFQQLGNAANRVGKNDTAFSYRDARYDCIAISGWTDPAESETNIRWTRRFFDLTRAFSSGEIYVNSLIEPDEPDAVKSAYRDETYERLVALKNKYDPTNFFRINPNIKPTVV